MTEENTGQQAAQEPEEGAFKPITSQEDLNRLIGARIDKVKSQFADYDELKTKAQQLAEIENANKTELQKEREAREEAERERDAARAESLRSLVAAEKGLSAAQAKRLVGSTKEELEKDADEMLAEFTPKKAAPKPGLLKSGSTSEPARPEAGRAAAALRQLRQG